MSVAWSVRQGRAAWLVVVIVAVGFGACRDSGGQPTPHTSVPPPETTTTSQLPTTTTLPPSPIGVGEASLSGTVVGTDGPVGGATVRVERVAGANVASADVVAVDGSWQLPSIPGGSYRVRAFRTPDFGQPESEVFFLGAAEKRTVELRVTRYDSDVVTAVLMPNPPVLDDPLTFTIQIRASRVDDQGLPTVTARAGLRGVLSVGEGLALESSAEAVTNAEGNAVWWLRCLRTGPVEVALAAGGATSKVNFPECVPKPLPPTTLPLAVP